MVITKSEVEVGEKPQLEFNEAEYRELAKSIGWTGCDAAISMELRPLRLYEFRTFLAANGICVFDEKRVREYMDAQVEQVNKKIPKRRDGMDGRKRWVWAPLDGAPEQPQQREVNTWTSIMFMSVDLAGQTRYEKPIPLPVLMTAKTIKDQFPAATFEVTDITNVPRPDPFLSVLYEGERFIIERWDEPGFRM